MFGYRKLNGKWPAGIPKYKESDLLQGQELLKFAMYMVKMNELDPEGYSVLVSTDDLNQTPNFVCEKDGERVFIVVKAAIAPDMPHMSVEEKKFLLQHAENCGITKCYFAAVGIGSRDPQRFEASLALKNDKYLINYTGLEKIAFKRSDLWIKKTLEEIQKLDPSTQAKKPGKFFRGEDDSGVMFSCKEEYEPDDVMFSWKTGVGHDYDAWMQEVKTETFQEMLLKHIEKKGLTNQEFYSAALIDRKLFSAIKNNPNYQPKKETAVACCLGLGLNWEDSEKLLEVAGYKLSLSISWDRVVYYCLHNGITDIDVVNELLYEQGDRCIRV